MVFKNCIDNCTSPNVLNRSNIIPVHKNGDKKIVDNYRSVSVLPIFGKILEKLLFNSLIKCIEENSLLSTDQSSFGASDSFKSDLLSIVYDIYALFDRYQTLEVRWVFLDISKVFDWVLHESLIYKIQSIVYQVNPWITLKFL